MYNRKQGACDGYVGPRRINGIIIIQRCARWFQFFFFSIFYWIIRIWPWLTSSSAFKWIDDRMRVVRERRRRTWRVEKETRTEWADKWLAIINSQVKARRRRPRRPRHGGSRGHELFKSFVSRRRWGMHISTSKPMANGGRGRTCGDERNKQHRRVPSARSRVISARRALSF